MQAHEAIHLVLFFTRGVSLQTWARIGSLEREIAIYTRLQERGVKVGFVTYGGRDDLKYAGSLGGIEILCNQWGFPLHLYEWLLPLLHARALRRASVFKTNQTNGADVALRVARFWRKPLIARCGFMWSTLADREGRREEAVMAQRIERDVFSNARCVVVTTPVMKEYVLHKYKIPDERVRVTPNYVLTDAFSPEACQPSSNRVCFIGRLSEEKNLFSLIEACDGLDVELMIIGEGRLRSSLQECAEEHKVKLSIPGNVPHRELPALIRESAIFALVSFHEGHPKALIEAMSCGMAVLGADSPGIREQIVHGKTGWLSGTDPKSIREAIEYLLARPKLRRELGFNARAFVEENYSLDRVEELEYSILQDIRKNGEIE